MTSLEHGRNKSLRWPSRTAAGAVGRDLPPGGQGRLARMAHPEATGITRLSWPGDGPTHATDCEGKQGSRPYASLCLRVDARRQVDSPARLAGEKSQSADHQTSRAVDGCLT